MNNKQKLKLIADAHSLKPVVMLGQKGLTDNVLAEIDNALTVHELIKVKLAAEDKLEREELTNEICLQTRAEQLRIIGNIAIIYRENLEQ